MRPTEWVRAGLRNLRHARPWTADYWYSGVQLARGALSVAIREDPRSWLEVDGAPALPVVVLPGIYETWRMMRPVADALRRAGHPVHVVPEVGLNLRRIPEVARDVVDHVVEAGLDRFALVAHSKGGLVGKAVLLHPTVGDRVTVLVTVATPFAGSSWAVWAPPGTGIRSLTPWSRGVRTLSREARANARIVSLVPRWDPHVPEHAAVAGGTNIRLEETGHFAPLGSPAVHRTILDHLGPSGQERGGM
ncbi:MAG: esterase/lipase family protein [Actinomycetota bacterium]